MPFVILLHETTHYGIKYMYFFDFVSIIFPPIVFFKLVVYRRNYAGLRKLSGDSTKFQIFENLTTITTNFKKNKL